MTPTPSFAAYVGAHWAAVIIYVIATVVNVYALLFRSGPAERWSYRLVFAGWVIHSAVICYWWWITGHGPYLTRNEVLSSDAWIALTVFMGFQRLYPRVRPASIVVFPAVFLMIALGLFFDVQIRTLPPTFSGIWLVIHIAFYKIALGTILIALACSVFLILKKRTTFSWLQRLPDLETLDLHAYRFAGFGFIIWAIAMLAGSIWAYKSWGRFWGWDPVENWSLITWILFGIHLHLRRFFRWSGERAAWFYVVCFIFSLVALFYTSHLNTSIHMEYFR